MPGFAREEVEALRAFSVQKHTSRFNIQFKLVRNKARPGVR
jgi:hypothetical protein